MNKKIRYKSILFLVPVLGIAFAQATPDEAPCALVLKAGKGSQLIPPQGKVAVHFAENAPVVCGSMLITHDEPFWVKTSDSTVIKLAPHSFVEVPKSKSKDYRLYRGEAVVTAPPAISKQVWSTPNSESEFKGGIAWIQYDATARVTTVACFNRSFEFKNKFNEDAKQTIQAGEMSHLAIQDSQVVPSLPAVMNHESVSAAVTQLSLPKEDAAELVAIVKRVYEDRSKSLVSEMEQWQEIEEKKEPSRSIASVPEKSNRKAVDENEASFVNHMLKARLYGEDEPQANSSRTPAGVDPKISDSEKTNQTKKLNVETKRVEKEIDSLKDSQD